MMMVAFCSLIRRDASAMKCSGFCLNCWKTTGWMPPSMWAMVVRVSWVFSASLPSRQCGQVERVVGVG